MKWLTVAVLIIIVFLIAMGAGAGSLIGIPDWSNNGDFLTMIFFVFVILMAVWWLGNSGNAEKPTAPAGGKPG
jgi:membrane protease YdiL (CAAX protease family)